MHNISIIGTSHIAKESLEKVKVAIESGRHDIICLELDDMRLHALLNKTRSNIRLGDISRIGIKGYAFSLLGAWVENRLGKLVGVKPGAEMLAAYRLAKKRGLKVALIDQPIDITLQKFSKSITWKEKWRFLVDILKGFILREQELNFDLTKVPPEKIMNELISRVKHRYPNFYRVLVTERNAIMARNIARVINQNPEKKVLAIVGAGHEKELLSMLKDYFTISYSFSVG
jgi:pheromone shutdown protein TraB